MLQRIRNVLQVTGRRYDNVSGTSCKLRDQDVKTYQERLAKLLDEHVRTYQERLASCLKKSLQHISNIWQVTSRRVFNVAGTSCMLVEEVVPTYLGRLASYLKNMLQRIRNIWQVI